MIRRFFIKCFLLSLCTGTELIEKSSHVANRVFQRRLVTCIFWRNSDPENVDNFLKLFHGLKLTISEEEYKDMHQNQLNKCKQTVLFAPEPEDFHILLYLINKKVKEAIYMILVVTKSMTEPTAMTNFTKLAWENDIGNIMIFSSNEQGGNVNVTTFLSYSDGECDNYSPVTNIYEKNVNFIRKYKNFYQCSIKITGINLVPYVTFQVHNDGFASIGGLDGDIITVVLDKLNATAKVVEPPIKVVGEFVNGSGTGIFGDLVYGKVDLMVPGITVTLRRYAVAQLSHVYQSVNVVWCGPNRREIYPWAKVLLPFFSKKTPFIALAFFLVIVSIILIEHFGFKKVKFKNIIFSISALFFGQTINFERDYWLSNSIFVIWIWFCLIIRVAYQGDLINNFGLKIFEPPMTHISDALQNVDAYGGSAGYAFYYSNRLVKNNYQELILSDVPVHLKEISEGRRYLLLIDEHMLWYINKPVQILEERMAYMPSSFYLRPHWPAAEEVDDKIVKVIEAGIVTKVLRKLKEKQLVQGIREAKAVKPIELATLSACFYGLIMMYFICLLVFCLELCCNKFKKRSRNQIIT